MKLLLEKTGRRRRRKTNKNHYKLQSPVKIRRSKGFIALMAGRNLPPLVHNMEEQKTP
jgi:hypothetical protein